MLPPTPQETVYSGPPPIHPKRVEADSSTLDEVEHDVNRFVAQVFGWMTGALLLSAFFASYADDWEIDVPAIISVNGLFLILGGMLLVALLVSRKIGNMSSSVAIATLVAYASLQGTLFGLLYRIVYGGSLVSCYLAMAMIFAGLCAYGFKTAQDPTSLSCLMAATAAALLLAALSKLLFDVPLLTACATCSCAWLLIGLAAYHRDFLRNLPASFEDDVAWHKAAAIGALQIYLDLMIVLVIILQARWLRSSVRQLSRKERES